MLASMTGVQTEPSLLLVLLGYVKDLPKIYRVFVAVPLLMVKRKLLLCCGRGR